MIKVNKKTEYALMALRYIMSKKSDELTTARELCDHFGTPFDTTAKVLQVMNQNKILRSVKGINGGYTLAISPANISFSELTRIIDGKNDSDHFCQNSKGMCDLHKTCNIATPLEMLNNKIKDYLNTITLQDLFEGQTIRNLSENM